MRKDTGRFVKDAMRSRWGDVLVPGPAPFLGALFMLGVAWVYYGMAVAMMAAVGGYLIGGFVALVFSIFVQVIDAHFAAPEDDGFGSGPHAT